MSTTATRAACVKISIMAVEEAQVEPTGKESGPDQPAFTQALIQTLPASAVSGVQKILSSVRSHLDMDVAFISEFIGDERLFRNVDAKHTAPLAAGDVLPLSDGYCQGVVDGVLPELIVDTAFVLEALAIPQTHTVPIGSHLSVPIRLKSGHVYGTFCCFNFASDPSLNPRDLQFMRAFADVAAFQIDHELEIAASRAQKSARIVAALAQGQPAMVFQPVVSLSRMRVVGLECLARFGMSPARTPDRWFAEAAEMGYGPALELQAIRNALDDLQRFGVPDDVTVWLNTSASTLMHTDLAEHFQGFPADRIVLELTEHDHVSDYAALNAVLRPLRARGVCVAIDDAGAGYSSMSHILNIAPDHIKLDLSLTRNIDTDRKRLALAAALIEFGRQTECSIVAEGVESVAELDALRRLGVEMAQGYFLSRPLDLKAVPGTIAAFARRGSAADVEPIDDGG